MRYSIIIPAHNEAHRIEATLEEYATAFPGSEILVVANGCTDDTPARVARIAERHPGVRCIQIDHTVGKGGAVRAGFLAASAPLVAFADADGSTPAFELARLFDALGLDDALIGSRWMPGSHVVLAQSLLRRVASRVFNALVRALFGLRFTDTQCGAKVFRQTALQRVVTHLETSNMAFDVELLLALRDAGLLVREEPTLWLDSRDTGISLLPTSLKMLAALVRMRIRRSFFRVLVPLFDHFFETTPLRAHDGFNVLILNWRDPTHPQAGGAEAYMFEMARRWVSWGHRVSWLTASYPGATYDETIEGVEIRRVGTAVTVYGAVPIEYLRNFRDRFDVILDAENGIPFFSPFFSMKPKICVMHHVHQQVLRKHLRFPLSAILAWAERVVMPRAYKNVKFVAVSEDTRREMESLRLAARPIEVVHNGVAPDLAPGRKAALPTVLCLGRLKPYKRIDLVVRAFARVRESVPNAVLRIAGSGDAAVLAQLSAFANELGVRAAVFFEGYVDGERKRALLQEAWVCVSASEVEGWGVTTIEANACGTPAVAFAVPGLREAIVHDCSGLLVREGGDLAAAVTRILTDEALRSRLESGALARAKEFSWDRAAEAMMDVIAREVIGQHYCFVRRGEEWILRGADVARVAVELRA